MTEIPEHLLRRSKERREALGLSSPGGSATPPAPAEAAGPVAARGPDESAEPAAATGGGALAAPAAAPPAAPGPRREPTPVPSPEAGLPATTTATAATSDVAPYLAPGRRRSKLPPWIVPVLVFLPLWAILYIGAFGERASEAPADPVEVGRGLFASQGCSGCHGANGEGGVGPAMQGGATTLTFPNVEEHIAFVKAGSATIKGQPYGDPARPGGQRVATTGGMPSFAALSDEELRAVVAYEREAL